MRLTTTLAATGGAVLIGALTLGAALPASAAPTTNDSAKAALPGDRLQGPWMWGPLPSSWGATYMAVLPDLRYSATDDLEVAKQKAIVATFPAIGTPGKIEYNGKCLGAGPTKYVAWVDCDSAAAVDFTVKSSGYITSRYGSLDQYDGYGMTLYAGGAGVEWMNVSALSPVKTIADPTANVISTNPADKSGVIGGKGEPGATIEVTDPTGKKHTTAVDRDGNWQITVPGLNFGDNAIPVVQKVKDMLDKSTSVTIPLAPLDLSAAVKSTNKDDKTAVVGGKGQPGADITVTAPDGTKQTVKVDQDGNWSATVPGLKTGANPIKVEQAVEGAAPQTKELVATIGAADLSAEVISTDADKGTAVVGGKGEPGADIVVTGPEGPQTVKVGDDGKWQVEVPGMKEGDNPVKVEQKVGDDTQTKDLVVTLLPSPIANPAIAGGAAIAALAALGTVLLRRRKLQQQ